MIIYIVTSGSYSDYEIQAVFGTQELAQGYIDARAQESFDQYQEWLAQGKLPMPLPALESIKQNYNIEQWELNKEYDGEIEEAQ